MHYLLIYELAEDYMDRRKKHRTEHLQLAWEANRSGHLILGGALAEPADQAILLFEADSPDPVKTFAKNDPYVKNGLVKNWKVRPWTTVVGEQASNPVKPQG